LSFSQALVNLQRNRKPAGGNYEKGFSEGANIQGSGEILFSLGLFLIWVYPGFEWITLNHFPFLEGRGELSPLIILGGMKGGDTP